MPKCQKCGGDIGENVRFCTNCGTPVSAPKPEEKPAPRDTQPTEVKPDAQAAPTVTQATSPDPQLNTPQNDSQPQFNAPQSDSQPQFNAPPQPQNQQQPWQQYGTQPQYNAQPQYQQSYAAPAYTPAPEMNAWNHFVTLFLISLPIVGFIIYLVWLFGGSKYKQRVSFVRGHLIFTVIVLLITALITWSCYGAIVAFTEKVIDEVNEKTGGNYGSFNDFFEDGGLYYNFGANEFDY